MTTSSKKVIDYTRMSLQEIMNTFKPGGRFILIAYDPEDIDDIAWSTNSSSPEIVKKIQGFVSEIGGQR